MKKDILSKAVRLADRSTVRPEKVVIAKPGTGLFVKKPAAAVLSERLNTRITKSEMKRLIARNGKHAPLSALLRHLILSYLDNPGHDQSKKTK